MFPVVVLLVTNFVLLVEVCPPAPKVDIAFEIFVFELSVFAGAVTGSAGGLGLSEANALIPHKQSRERSRSPRRELPPVAA